MVSSITCVLRALPGLALRQVVGLLVLLCLVLGPVGSAMAQHHVDDADSSLVLSLGTTDADAAKTGADHGLALPGMDHDCHGCAIAMVPAPTKVVLAPVSPERNLPALPLVTGQAPSAELRPPRS